MRYENRGNEIIKHEGGKEFIMVAANVNGMDAFVWEEIKTHVEIHAELFDLMKDVIARKRTIRSIRLFLLNRWDVFFSNEAVSAQCRAFTQFSQVEEFMSNAKRAKPLPSKSFW